MSGSSEASKYTSFAIADAYELASLGQEGGAMGLHQHGWMGDGAD